MPPMKQIRQAVLAQPATVWPHSAAMTAQRMPTKLMTLMSSPQAVMMRMGFTDRLVMPSKARAIIFFSG